MSTTWPQLAPLVETWRLGHPVRTWAPTRVTNNHVHILDLGDRRVVVRVYQNLDQGQVAAEHALLAALGRASLPFAVPCPLPDAYGRTWVPTPYGPAAVFTWIAGDRPRLTLEVLERVGQALGRLDRVLAGMDDGLAPHDWRRDLAATHPAVTGLGQLAGEFGDSADLTGLPALDEAYARLLAHAPVQLVHQDIGLSNMLTGGGEVVAVLDFELVGLDLRVSDPVAALVQTGCLDHAVDDPLARASALLRGYGREVRLSEREIDALPELVRFRAAGAVIWRYGRYLRGQSDRDDVLEHLADLRRTDAWARAHGDELVTVAARWCG